MKIIRQKKDLFKTIDKKYSISLIPTMGGLHKGHESLIYKAKKKNKKILVTIFINPKQFNSKKDFEKYPRNLAKDIKILRKNKIDYLYCPKFKDIFSFKTYNKIYMHPFSKQLCGKYRPGHFKGVLNVVNRFLEIFNPRYLFLGEKDFQQLILIKEHIKKRKIKTTVISCKTVRSQKYLPYSSRNFNLKSNEKNLAIKAFKLIRNEKKLIKKYKNKDVFQSNIKNKLKNIGIKKIDYIKVLNDKKFNNSLKNNLRIFSAFYINKIRLIDNF